MVHYHFKNMRLGPILDPFLVSKRPIFKVFGTFWEPKWLKTGSKWAILTCACTPNGRGSILGKRTHVLDPFLNHFFALKGSIFAALWDLRRPKMGHHRLKTG